MILPRTEDQGSPAASAGSAEDDRAYATITVFCSLMAATIAGMFWVTRIGFDNPLAVILKPLALSLFLASFPLLVRQLLKAQGPGRDRRGWITSFPFLWLAGIALAGVLGWLVRITGINAFPVLAFAGAAGFLLGLGAWLRRTTGIRAAIIAGTAVAMGIWASGVVWGRIYKNPLFIENLILDGKVHHDALFLSTMSNMLRTYGVPSIGADGLNHVPYHWGTGWLFAQFSNLTGASGIDFYQLGFPVTMIPFFFGGTLAFAATVRSYRRTRSERLDLGGDLRYWLVFGIVCIGAIPLPGLDAMGVWTSNYLISESYTVAVPVALLLAACALVFGSRALPDRAVGPPGPGRPSAPDIAFLLVVIPAGLVVLGYLKISLMLLGFAACLYLFVRLGLFRHWLYALSAVATAIAVFVAYGQVSLPAHREGIAPFDYLLYYIPPAWWPYFFLVHLFWSWLFVVLRLRKAGITTLGDLRLALRERRLLDVELVTVIALLGVGPGLLLRIDGGSAYYFSDVQRWLAAGLILSRLPEFAGGLLRRGSPEQSTGPSSRLSLAALPVRSLLVLLLLLPVLGSMLFNAAYWPAQMLRANVATRHALYPAERVANLPVRIRTFPRLLDSATLAAGLRSSRNAELVRALRVVDRLPLAEKSRMALFIPQTQTQYWRALTRPGACTFQPLVATALTSLAMIDGMPAYGCQPSRYYGLGSFTPRKRLQMPIDGSPPVLCQKAERFGATRVLVLSFDMTRSARANLLDCRTRSWSGRPI